MRFGSKTYTIPELHTAMDEFIKKIVPSIKELVEAQDIKEVTVIPPFIESAYSYQAVINPAKSRVAVYKIHQDTDVSTLDASIHYSDKDELALDILCRIQQSVIADLLATDITELAK